MCKNIVRFNPWIEGTIISGAVLSDVHRLVPDLTERFDLVHFLCQYESRNWMHRFAPHCPVVTTHHHVADWELDRHNMEGDCIMVVAKEWEEDLAVRGIEMSRVFRYSNGVDATRFVKGTFEQRRVSRQELGIPEDSFTVGFFAKRSSNNHNDRKGTDVFEAAAQQLGRDVPNATVLLIGPGWQDLVGRLNEAGIRCVWRSFIEGDLAPVYHSLDAYWITSRIEGGPVPLLEAMSSEVCCVTTPVGLVPEIGEPNGNLMQVPFDDPQAVVAATVELAADSLKRSRMGAVARATILEKKHLAITTHEVAKAYDIARDNYLKRSGRAAAELPSPGELATIGDMGEIANPEEFVPLAGVPSRFHETIGMLENFCWADALLAQDQRGEAMRWLRRECRQHPFSLLAWRRYLRRAMPDKLVRNLVGIFRGSTATGSKT